MRHGQGFDLMLEEYLRLVAQPGPGTTGAAAPATGFERYRPTFDWRADERLDDPAQGVGIPELMAILARLGSQMHLGSARASTRNGTLPAGYTYLAQFAIHDLVNTAGLRATRDRGLPKAVFANVQTSALDLSSLYGAGPAESPVYFEPTEETEHRARFRLGWMHDPQTGKPARQEDIARLPLGPLSGAAPGDGRFEPLVADTRNADNLILSQLAVLFMQAHNRLYDLAFARAASGQARHGLLERPYKAARCMVTAIYRGILRDDLLPRLLPDAARKRFFEDGHAPRADVTLEAALAGLRFGHALVQQRYAFNADHDHARSPTLRALMDFFGMRGGHELPLDATWVIDWRRFFEMPGADSPDLNLARPLGPTLADALRTQPGMEITPPAALPGLLPNRLGLAWRTLAKGVMGRLPTGQALAQRLVAERLIEGRDILPKPVIEAILRDGRTANCRAGQCLTDADIVYLADRTPLFFYILAEAQHFGAGAKLGPVGGQIVADTFAMALEDTGFEHEQSLEAAAHALWQEVQPDGATPMPATMPALIAFVEKAKAGAPPPADP